MHQLNWITDGNSNGVYFLIINAKLVSSNPGCIILLKWLY